MTPPDDQPDSEPRSEDDAPEGPPPTREIRRDEGGDKNAPLVGETLGGRYKIESHLGEGAMGAVYLAEHVRIGRRDAIKILNPELSDDEDAWARFTREARNASHINHPNVCTVYDFGETSEGLPYIAMEYVDGETLTRLMEREGPLPARRVLELAEQILDALDAAHSRGIVHRDLKPENIMLVRAEHGAGDVKVVDFGIAKAMQDDDGRQDITREGFAVGTPRYVAPEQVSGKEIDRRSDLYSLGIVLYEMLTGRLPFTGESWREVMTKRLSEDPVPLREAAPDRHLGEELERVIGRALSRDPEDRYEDAEALRRALREAIRSPGSDGATVPGTEHIDIDEHVPETGEGPAVLDPASWPAAWRRGALAAVLLLGAAGAGWFGLQALGGGEGAGTAAGSADEAGQVAMAEDGTGGGAAEPAGGDGSGGGGQDGGPAEAGAGDGGDGGDAGGADGGGDVTIRDGGGGETGDGGAAEPAGGETGGAAGGQAGGAADGRGDTGGEAAPPLAGLSTREMEDWLLDVQGELSLGSVSASRLPGIEDTARAVWERTGLSDPLRADAAFTRGLVRVQRGDTAEAIEWVRRAIGLNDIQGYRTRLELWRGGGR